jgi:hypothetical protein
MPAPLVYSVLGRLKMVGHGLPQALRQLADGLALSLDVYEVYEDDGADPVVSVELAAEALREAAALVAQCGVLLERAQSAISRQGFRG